MAGNFFGSGDKTQSAEDNRIGLANNAILVQPGGFIFNPGRAVPNETLSAAATPTNWPALVGIVAVSAGAAWLLVILFKRKS